MFRICLMLLVVVATASPVTVRACADFGPDAYAVARVQSSWGPAEQLMAKHRYTEALAKIESTNRFLAQIHDPKTRACVAEGARTRIVEARAGQKYLQQYPDDPFDASMAAQNALTNLKIRHDCP